ncbi:M48 family metalloprotease [uncultured Ramlibacter sp.]|uniref:M48 family metalloprotease n=1 Tax=uncultured Ramlibacter sp. TaxID=260755 RepID=UPI002638DF54|nr:M48 family metalloprotease [uncultured Ramlibacter sp.]
MKRLNTLLACACLVLLAPSAMAQNKTLNLLNSLVGGQPGASPLGVLLAPQAAAPRSGGDSILDLLSQASGEIEEAKEVEIGRQLAAVLLGSKPLSPDMALQRYVNQLGRWISLQSSRPQLPWSFAVIDDPGFNAFAAPGGYVFVTKGLVDSVDEAELAGILAHEISHVTERHHLNALRAKARAGIATQLIGSQLRNNLGGFVSQQMLSLGRNLYSSGLDQDDEFDADRRGVALAARAGFDPYGLASVLQQLRTATPDNPLFTLSLATHPPAQQRLDLLEQAMGNRLDALSGKPSVSVAQRVQGKRR